MAVESQCNLMKRFSRTTRFIGGMFLTGKQMDTSKVDFRSISLAYGLVALILFGTFCGIALSAPVTTILSTRGELLFLLQVVLIFWAAVGIWRKNIVSGFMLGFGIASAYVFVSVYNITFGVSASPVGPVLFGSLWLIYGASLYQAFRQNWPH